MNKYPLSKVVQVDNVLPSPEGRQFYFLCEPCFRYTGIYKHSRFEDEPTEIEMLEEFNICRCTPLQFRQGYCSVVGCKRNASYWFYYRRDV